MKSPLDNKLNRAYEAFNQNHNHLRQKLMASLPYRLKHHKQAGHISHLLAFTGETIMKNRIIKRMKTGYINNKPKIGII